MMSSKLLSFSKMLINAITALSCVVTYHNACLAEVGLLQADEHYPYIDYNHINDIAVDEGRIWCGCMGAVVRWDIDDGTYEIFTGKDGLLNKEVTACAVDSEHRIWIGYLWCDGVSCFDGSGWHTYDVAGHVNDILFDQGGVLWFGESFDLTSYNGAVWNSYGNFSTVVSIVQDCDQTIWLGAGQDVWSNESGRWLRHESGIAGQVSDMAAGWDGTIWVSSVRGVYNYDGRSWSGHDNNIGPIYTTSVDTYESSVWIGSNQGLYKLDGSEVEHYTTRDGLPDDFITTVACDSTGCIWLGTRKGLVKFDGAEFTCYAIDMPDDMYDWSMAIDRNDTRWYTKGNVGPSDKAIYRNEGSGLKLISDSGSSGHAFCALAGADGCMWFGTEWGVTRYDGLFWHRFRRIDGLIDDYVVESYEDGDGVLWFGTNRGVSRYDGAIWSNYTEGSGLVSGLIRTICCDLDGSVWFGTPEGVSKFDGVSWQTYTAENGLASNRVYSSAVDHDNIIWFGTRDGVSSFDGSNWTTYRVADGLADNRINDVQVDKDNRKWFATGSGVSCFDGDTWRTYTTADGLPSLIVHTMAVDAGNTVWLMTYEGEASIRDGMVSVAREPAHLRTMDIDGVYPNPFNPATTIRFTLPHASDVTLDIYNAAGQKIRTLASGRMEAGEHNVRWNGLLDSGVSAASGVYIARLKAGNTVGTGRMVLVR